MGHHRLIMDMCFGLVGKTNSDQDALYRPDSRKNGELDRHCTAQHSTAQVLNTASLPVMMDALESHWPLLDLHGK